ncbi:MAG: hypothetical protein ACTTI5_06930 [Treponema sp.]
MKDLTGLPSAGNFAVQNCVKLALLCPIKGAIGRKIWCGRTDRAAGDYFLSGGVFYMRETVAVFLRLRHLKAHINQPEVS